MKLIVGLGNPGPRYRETLHNLGFAVVDEVAARYGAGFGAAPADAVMAKVPALGGLMLAKPLTYVNLSGGAVSALVRYYRIEPSDLLVVTDDVNLAVGRLRIRPQGSAGGHNGLRSIIAALGSDVFPRLRIGVGRGDARRDLADHVLARIPPADRPVLDAAVARAADAVEQFASRDLESVMNVFNPAEPGGPAG